MNRITVFVWLLALLCSGMVAAQNEPTTWHRSTEPVRVDLHLFRSTHGISLPTAEALQKGNFEFEISHRFYPPIADGIDALYGFDGPVAMRLALAYAVSNRLAATLGRSNVDKNIDLQLKYRSIEMRGRQVSAVVAGRAGMAWNALKTYYFDKELNLVERPKNHKSHFQYYLQAIVNAMPDKRVCLGLVPSYLVNRDIHADRWTNAFTLGTNANVYLDKYFSLIGECSFLLTDKYGRHNPGAVGIEVNTGGHFFKLFVTNQIYLNPSQYLAGAVDPFAHDKIHLGFLITRLLQ